MPSLVGFVKEIDTKTFSGCSSLSRVDLPVTLVSLDDDAFAYCVTLQSIILPNAVATLGSSVFEGCSSLATVELSNSLKKIGSSAFKDCLALTTIHCNAAIPPECKGDNVFKNVPVGSCQLHVPKGCKNLYMSAKAWSTFNSINEMMLVRTNE